MLRDFLVCHITASLWLMLVLLSAYVAGKPVTDVALEFYILIFAVYTSGGLVRAGLNKALGAEEEQT